ncbi:cation transporter [uncultured Bartonella sp.]|uniref:cation diffusion facilitator family transporter n=1 Tax=uncultured Bartonella sp. TaxID=104108 RepID=UPI00260D4120|nr:cation transporter [uncultured Bartonella sp.]
MQSYDKTAIAEQRVLEYSIIATIILAVCGIFVGILTGASSIIFDGMYSSIDCVFSVAALFVARLIQIDVNRRTRKAPKFVERFQYGFWHLEPMLLVINGVSLMIAIFYALFEAAVKIWHGGQIPRFGVAAWFAIFAVALCFGMAFYEHYRNRKIGSAFIAIDAKSWIISGGIGIALLCAFSFANIVEDTTSYIWLLPYIDPSVLAIIALIMLPVPVKTVIRAMRDILLITPASLDDHVNAVVDAIVEKYGFVGSQNYLAKVGRSTMIEIHLILPEEYHLDGVGELDRIRAEIGDQIGNAGPDRWLTVSFTAKPEWAY